ncbi:hypothetical protein C8J56DRAFT_926294 [Mycena floridula]|nr:hypothetical protein C8J56DRAFT_926294 [Mycena floridula]
MFSDSRTHFSGPSRAVQLSRVSSLGGGAVSKSEDGLRCAVTGQESLRIVRLSDPLPSQSLDHRYAIGRGGYRIDCSRNFWDGSGLKNASTDIAWGIGSFDNKIITSARNGEIIIWDINKSGSSKLERRTKDHTRSISKLSISQVVSTYLITGSADGDVRVWDLRDMSKSIMRVHHPTSVRSLVFSPSLWKPLQAVVGLDNGTIYRWDLQMGQRGQLDRVPLAHTASVTALDWCNPSGASFSPESESTPGLGWIVSGGLDRAVKIWDLSAPDSSVHIPHKPTYTLHPSFPVRRVLWRPSYECEIAIVSNAEFGSGSNPDLAQKAPVPGPAGTSDSLRSRKGTTRNSGDVMEIWDVRRGWIAKWKVGGATADGAITDIAFRDSHTIWGVHSSGMFSQIDLRETSKPLDTVMRTAVTWGASGSLAFVADHRLKWEAPYDDIAPSQRDPQNMVVKLKALGDRKFSPTTQGLGTFTLDETGEDLDGFVKLAQGYVFDSADRRTMCELNAELALQVGKEHIAQVWLLLATSLAEIAPPEPEILPMAETKTPRKPSLPSSVSAPAVLSTTSFTFPLASVSKKQSSPNHITDSIPRVSQRSGSTSTSRKLTPTSSNSSSPQQPINSLPPVTPRQPYLGRRESVDSNSSRRPLGYRRTSASIQSASPSDKNSVKLRHVGEGALDDSDSSGSDDDVAPSSEDETRNVPNLSPAMTSARLLPAHPSPLSRIAGRNRWSEDEDGQERDDDDASSPSPQSTDTEAADSEGSPPRRSHSDRSSRRHSSRKKSRSRSSTVALLAAPISPPSLTHQTSHTSIRTVIAGENSLQDSENARALKEEETIRNLASIPTHQRQKSQAISEFVLDDSVIEEPRPTVPAHFTQRRQEIVSGEEEKLREMVWNVLRGILETFADEGDVQTCAMLALVAPKELDVSSRRTVAFVDAYIDILTRLQLHTCSAYLRKYCQAEDIHNATLLETTIYTACGRCRTTFVSSSHRSSRGTFAYCANCRLSVTCSICRLPVRGLMFQCSVCTHGGHQSCYRQYYSERSSVELPRALVGPLDKGHSISSNSDTESTSDSTTAASSSKPSLSLPASFTKMNGHLCAAGCGHYCWMSNE